jgi:ABC-type nitrate/sulfonate/bicarbonate transport system permease component
VFGVLAGIVIGVVIGSSKLAYDVTYPLLVGFSSIPKVAVVPLFVVWFGAGTVPAILTSMVISIFPVVVNVATGLASTEPELEDVLRVLGAQARHPVERRPAARAALPVRVAQDRDHAVLRGHRAEPRRWRPTRASAR